MSKESEQVKQLKKDLAMCREKVESQAKEIRVLKMDNALLTEDRNSC